MDVIGDVARSGQLQDFAKRFDQGQREDNFNEEEAYDRFEEVSRDADREEFDQSARDSLARLSPDERREFEREVRERAGKQGVDLHNAPEDSSPEGLAGLLGSLQEQAPGLLGSLFGGSSRGFGGNSLAKVALGGVAAMAAKRFLR
jgi:hypothetical protein